MPSISQRVRLAIRNQLASQNAGFNTNFGAALDNYGVDPHAINWHGIEWTGNTTNFLYGRVSAAFIDQLSGKLDYPILTIDTAAGRHTNEVISATFSGSVVAIIELHLGWSSSDVLQDFASYADAADDAMFATINNLEAQNYGAGILYNGRMSFQRGAIEPGGPSWRQTITFTPEFKVITL